MTDHQMLNKEQGNGVFCETVPLNGKMAAQESQNGKAFRQDGAFYQPPQLDEIALLPQDDEFVRHHSAPIFGYHIKGLKSEGASQQLLNDSSGELQEEIFINNFNGQRKGSVTLLVKEQQCNKRLLPSSSISYQKPQDPRLQLFRSMNSLPTPNAQKLKKESNDGTQQQEEQNKTKRRLGFGQGLARKEDPSITKISASKNSDKPNTSQPPTLPPKFSMPLQWHQNMKICQQKFTDAKNNITQISEDLNLLTTELQHVQQQGDQLQIQIQNIDQNIEKLDECPEEGGGILGDENEGDDSFEDDESLTSAHLPVNSNSNLNFLYDSGEEVDQNIVFKNLLTFNNNDFSITNFSGTKRQTFKSAVQFLRIRKIVQFRLSNNNQIWQNIKEENQKRSKHNEVVLKSLMPLQKEIREKKNQRKFEYLKSSNFLKNFVRSYHENELRLALNYRRQMHQYKRLLRDSNLEDDDEELEIFQPLLNSVKFKQPKQFRTLRSTELAQAVKTIKKGIFIPNQICENHSYGKWQKIRSKFVGCRSKIQDPVGEMVQELVGSPWTEQQINLFVQAFLQYPKEYEKIADQIPGRNSRECVAFYYRNQKQEWFAPTKRKLHMMRRQKRQDIRKAESFMQIQKASYKRLNNQNNINNQINTAINNNNSTINNTSSINTQINFTNTSNIQENSTQQQNGKHLPEKTHIDNGIKTFFELTGAQRGRRSKRKRAKEVHPVPNFQQPPTKRKCIKLNTNKFQIPSVIKQKRPKIRENQMGKEMGGILPPQNQSFRAKRKIKEQQEKIAEICTSIENPSQNALIRNNKIFNTRNKNFAQNVQIPSSQWESIKRIDSHYKQIPPLFKNVCSTSPLKSSNFFTDFLHTCPQTSLFVKTENNNNNNNNDNIDSIQTKNNNNTTINNNNNNNNFNSSQNYFLTPNLTLTSLLEDTMQQSLGESSLFQNNNNNNTIPNSSFFQFGSKDLNLNNNRPSASSSPGSFPLGRQLSLPEIRRQFQNQQFQRQQNLSFPNRKFEPSKFLPPNLNLNLNLNSNSIVDQVISSSQNSQQQRSSFQLNNKQQQQQQNSSSYFWRDQFQQQLQGGPQIQQFGQQFLDQRQQFSQFQISGIDSILEKGSVGFNNNNNSINSNNNNNNFNKFPLDQYIFNQISDAGLMKCAGGFDGGASTRNIDGDNFNGL